MTERIGFEHDSEWSEIRLSDGTVLKAKLEVNGVRRVPGQWDANGDPQYQVNMSTRMAFVTVPEKFLKPAEVTPESVVEFKGKMDANLKGKAN